MNTNVDLIIQIAKNIIKQHPDLAKFFSQILFEAEKKQTFVNQMGSIAAIEWCCSESDFICSLDLSDELRDYLRLMMKKFH